MIESIRTNASMRSSTNEYNCYFKASTAAAHCSFLLVFKKRRTPFTRTITVIWIVLCLLYWVYNMEHDKRENSILLTILTINSVRTCRRTQIVDLLWVYFSNHLYWKYDYAPATTLLSFLFWKRQEFSHTENKLSYTLEPLWQSTWCRLGLSGISHSKVAMMFAALVIAQATKHHNHLHRCLR